MDPQRTYNKKTNIIMLVSGEVNCTIEPSISQDVRAVLQKLVSLFLIQETKHVSRIKSTDMPKFTSMGLFKMGKTLQKPTQELCYPKV